MTEVQKRSSRTRKFLIVEEIVGEASVGKNVTTIVVAIHDVHFGIATGI